jgi:pimeloyl-ACP methyl ester carboxylesterase
MRAVAYEESGVGVPLVLVHGHPFNRSMWSPQRERLSREFRVIALDLPGYGDSPPRSEVMTMRAFAEVVLELLDHLEIERAVIVGLSMGGLVAMELGLAHPERVHGVVLAATTAEPVANGEVEQRSAKAALALDRGMVPLAGEMIADLLGPRASRDHALVRRVFAMMLTASPAGAAAALRGRARRPDYSRLLLSLTVPALVIAGDHDAHAREPVVQQLKAALPAAELVRFSYSGHLPNLEEPDLFNETVRRFALRVADTSRRTQP